MNLDDSTNTFDSPKRCSSDDCEYLIGLFEKAIKYCNEDPQTSLNRSRIAGEALLKKLIECTGGSKARTRSIHKMEFEELKRFCRPLASVTVAAHIDNIQRLGNIGSHDQGNRASVRREDASACLSALANLYIWFFETFGESASAPFLNRLKCTYAAAAESKMPLFIEQPKKKSIRGLPKTLLAIVTILLIVYSLLFYFFVVRGYLDKNSREATIVRIMPPHPITDSSVIKTSRYSYVVSAFNKNVSWSNDDTRFEPVTSGLSVPGGSYVETGKESSATLSGSLGDVLILSEYAKVRLTIEELSESGSNISHNLRGVSLSKGIVNLAIKSGQGNFTVLTTTARINVKGTHFAVGIFNGTTRIAVMEGAVEVQDIMRPNQVWSVESGQLLTGVGSKSPHMVNLNPSDARTYLFANDKKVADSKTLKIPTTKKIANDSAVMLSPGKGPISFPVGTIKTYILSDSAM